MSRTDETTPKIRAAMTRLGPADARTIAETATVGYSTTVRKLREWGAAGTAARVDRGKDPAHWTLNPHTSGNPAAASGEDTGQQNNTTGHATTGGESAGTPQPPASAAAEPRATGPDPHGHPDDGDAPHAASPAAAPAVRPRRAKSELRNAVLSILQANPDKQYKISEVCKQIEQLEPGRTASAGAVANALHKFAGQGVVELTVDKPATFKAV